MGLKHLSRVQYNLIIIRYTLKVLQKTHRIEQHVDMKATFGHIYL